MDSLRRALSCWTSANKRDNFTYTQHNPSNYIDPHVTNVLPTHPHCKYSRSNIEFMVENLEHTEATNFLAIFNCLKSSASLRFYYNRTTNIGVKMNFLLIL